MRTTHTLNTPNSFFEMGSYVKEFDLASKASPNRCIAELVADAFEEAAAGPVEPKGIQVTQSCRGVLVKQTSKQPKTRFANAWMHSNELSLLPAT